MILSEWENIGVDVSAFTGITYFEDPTGLVHADDECKLGPVAPITLHDTSTPLCDVCWSVGLGMVGSGLAYEMEGITIARNEYRNGIEDQLNRDGIVFLLKALELLEGLEQNRHVGARYRKEWLEELDRTFPGGREAHRKECSPAGEKRAVLVVERRRAWPALMRIEHADTLEHFATWWRSEHEQAHLVVGPVSILEELTKALEEEGRLENVEYEELSNETPEQVETALALYDPRNPHLNRLTKALEVARAL